MIDTLPVSAVVGAALASVIGMCVVGWYPQRVARRSRALVPSRKQSMYLFQNGKVCDVVLGSETPGSVAELLGADWGYLGSYFRDRFPEMPADPPSKTITVEARDATGTFLQFRPEQGGLRVILDAPSPGAAQQHEAALLALEQERSWALMDTCPHPAWLTDQDQQVLWSNPAFEALCQSLGTSELGACPFQIRHLEGDEVGVTTRVSIENKDRQRRWYEVTSERTTHGNAHVATSIDALIEAENAQRVFVQTLAKTFAHLTTGLAVFDKHHKLVLFNPALLDLTGLSVEKLSARPGLTTFFDQLREARILPEPKNYNEWRNGLSDVVAAALDDRYSETWHLPSGLTYSVVGRPHPDGALAFLIEDISAEISLTRRFRAELELFQSVANCFDDAIAVFNRTGVLTFCNDAYKHMWKRDPSTAFAETTIVDATQSWREGCAPALIWTELRDFVLQETERAPWDAKLDLRDGTPLSCVVEPLTGGATMVRFVRKPAIDQTASAKQAAPV